VSRAAGSLVGRDLARAPLLDRPARGWLPACLVGALLAGLGLAALRVDVIRVRYALAESEREMQSLADERNALAARVRELRDPQRLGAIARERGYQRPERVIEIRPSDPRPPDARP
jgi:hypothetical protein